MSYNIRMKRNTEIHLRTNGRTSVLFGTAEREGKKWRICMATEDGARLTVELAEHCATVTRTGEDAYVVSLREGYASLFRIATPHGDIPMRAIAKTVQLRNFESGPKICLRYTLSAEDSDEGRQDFDLFLDCRLL